MSKDVYVIHGVNCHARTDFEAEVEGLRKAVDRPNLNFIPIFWGDKGGKDQYIDATLPPFVGEGVRSIGMLDELRYQTIADVLSGGLKSEAFSMSPQDMPSPNPALMVSVLANLTKKGLIGALGVRGGSQVMDYKVIQDGLSDSIQKARWLSKISNSDTVNIVAELIGSSVLEPPVVVAQVTRGNIREYTEAVGRKLAASVGLIDRLIGNVLGAAGQVLVQEARTKLGPTIARFLGDAFVYHKDPTVIENVIWDAIPADMGRSSSTPVSIIAHSFGGVIAFKMAAAKTNPLNIDNLITFGSQPSLFHVVEPQFDGLPAFDGARVVVPNSIAKWTNLWEPLDPLAFVDEKVFILANQTPIRDISIGHRASDGLWTHSAYWTSDTLIECVKTLADVD